MCPDDSPKQSFKPAGEDWRVVLRSVFEEGAAKESAPTEGVASDDTPDPQLERFHLETEGIKRRLDRLENLHVIRKIYVGLLFGLTVAWLGTVGTFVGFAGFRYQNFTLADSVIIAFITSTTVSVLGLFHFAAKWLFSASSEKDSETKKVD